MSSIVNRKSPIVNERAFTIVELLTVIAIIAILAAILLPALAAARVQAQKKQALLQIRDLATQIQNYDSAYSRMPISPAAQAAAMQTGNSGMFTYGGLFATPVNGVTWPPAPVPANYYPSNNEVIAILMDITNTTVTMVNQNHQKNPQQTAFLNAKMSGWDPTQGGTPQAGVGNDLIYRDPWGNPYVITMDLNADNQCLDAFYRLQAVSGTGSVTGLNGLINSTDANGAGNNFAFHGNVMVWSAGPDGKVDPSSGANSGVNKDNILSWQ
ncbi:MAG TPA: prepilin-type N-terminal cleavage/methylation domain-containing protein [Candidatus Acidoferrales bacterium]|nr:prepilin-type N-terminal cleavage/methylation domain-containing protein [Candidatus Acidoferrales bacterium]